MLIPQGRIVLHSTQRPFQETLLRRRLHEITHAHQHSRGLLGVLSHLQIEQAAYLTQYLNSPSSMPESIFFPKGIGSYTDITNNSLYVSGVYQVMFLGMRIAPSNPLPRAARIEPIYEDLWQENIIPVFNRIFHLAR